MAYASPGRRSHFSSSRAVRYRSRIRIAFWTSAEDSPRRVRASRREAPIWNIGSNRLCRTCGKEEGPVGTSPEICGQTCGKGHPARAGATMPNPGAIAQLGERLAGSQKVAGSSPAGSIRWCRTIVAAVRSAGLRLATDHRHARDDHEHVHDHGEGPHRHGAGRAVLGRRVPGRRVMVMPAIMNIRVTTRVTTILTGTDIRTAS